MKYKVELTKQANFDLLQMVEYFAAKVGVMLAKKKLDEIEQAINSLSLQPSRGHKPHELYNISASKQLEIIVDRVRIIYEIRANVIFIIAIFDGRQNVQAHLLKRMYKFH